MAERVCAYNSEIICDIYACTRSCTQCGWNPEEIKKRKSMIAHGGLIDCPCGRRVLCITTATRGEHGE